MIYEIFMPALSSTMTEGKITAWVKSIGDKVEKGETVLVVESDKADMDVESFYEGYLGAIAVPAGETAPVGSTLGYVAETVAEIADIKSKLSQTSEPVAASTNGTSTGTAIPEVVVTKVETPAIAKSDRLIATPRAKRIAKENNLDLAKINGSGPNGRITEQDVTALLQVPVQATPAKVSVKAPEPIAASIPSAPVSTTPKVTYTPQLGTTKPLTTLQNAVVRNMNASLSVPTFHVGYTITTTGLDELYKQIKSKGVTITALLAKAVAVTLQRHPIVNASFSDQGIVYKSDINVAIAVAMEDGGLITPVLPKANESDIYSLSRHWKSLVERARAKQLQPEEYNSGTFTISNLGMFGVDRFDAILPPNTGAILAIGASHPQVVATKDGAIAVRNQMQVNLTADHRIIYGADAAKFLQDLAKLLETDAQSLVL
ncbi:pyruvate/2-oxoglutarate dehydrogenase complex, dihydrolipoamide acyltransferase component [Synechococcus sp. PCC 7502]|uniref:dihydrolipoamide acetyltransferase family protein n=1 Tax=Synechococcus sp. PCC 7502 TaxID=1173263 RepID=UPI00029FEB33|nr:dihydrolipoamide acetyltransferase family protein [Synechococcus sp. PCC 7502]AFY72780.1 pyruvate/2-oxoglutarate dehydrogenase complex, dihydrolipoamide acyltransferase component [Synechococcus sp. PCC 7502]